MHTRGNHMENLKKPKPNLIDTLDKTNASENSKNGEYGKLKYKHGIRNNPQKKGSSTSTEKARAYTGKNVALATNPTLPDYKRKRSSYGDDDHHNRKLSRTSRSALDIHHVIDIMPKDKVPNSNDKSTIVQSEANLVSSVLRHHRPNSTSSIETPILKHTSGKKPRLLKVDSNTIETTSLSLFRAGEKRKSVPPEDSTKKFKKCFPRGKPPISGSKYVLDVKGDGNVPLSLPIAVGTKRKRALTEDSDRRLKKEKREKLSIAVGSAYRRDVAEDVLENMSRPVASNLSSRVVNEDIKICKRTRTLEKNSTIQTPVRCPSVIKFGKFEVETCYSCPFPQEEDARRLIFCEFCLKYTKCQSILERHLRHCYWRTPPGTEIYQSGDLSVFEVDGKVDKTYCQTLCRLGKLFLDLKTLDYGVEPFLFYIVTRNDGFGCHLVGYFSKLKQNEENFNVACIVIMPQYRRQGYGRILIEFSYLLSRIERQPGTPETPLSGLGKMAYDAYWKSVILEYLDKHRGNDKICINDVSIETGLMRQDIIDTFQSLHLVVEIFKDITICIDWNVVDSHVKKKIELKQVHIDPDRLRWTPSNLPDGQDNQPLEEPVFIKCIPGG